MKVLVPKSEVPATAFDVDSEELDDVIQALQSELADAIKHALKLQQALYLVLSTNRTDVLQK